MFQNHSSAAFLRKLPLWMEFTQKTNSKNPNYSKGQKLHPNRGYSQESLITYSSQIYKNFLDMEDWSIMWTEVKRVRWLGTKPITFKNSTIAQNKPELKETQKSRPDITLRVFQILILNWVLVHCLFRKSLWKGIYQ